MEIDGFISGDWIFAGIYEKFHLKILKDKFF
jgi:hypothetical protein